MLGHFSKEKFRLKYCLGDNVIGLTNHAADDCFCGPTGANDF